MTNKRIVITADRIGTLEQIDYRITRVEATRKKDLPDEYLYGFPCTYMVDNTLFVATIYKLTAGRTMGRKEFSRTHTLEDCEKEMDGILFDGYGLNRDGSIDLSEAPSAYKNIDKVIAEEADIVEVVVKLLPLGSVKDIRRPIL